MNRVAVVYSDYYSEITNQLLSGLKNNIDNSFEVSYFNVPGSWDLVYKIQSLTKEFNIFAAVGVVCKGETDHYEYISNAVANGLINISVNSGVYIANCVLNVNNLEQAEARANQNNNKGTETAEAINILFT